MNDHDRLKPLAELDDYELKNDGQDIRGQSLLGPAGQPLGVIRELLVDKDHDRVAAVRLEGGGVYPVESLERRGQAVVLRESGAASMGSGSGEEARIPIVQEEMLIGKREVDRGGVRVQSRIVEEPVREQVSLRDEHVSVERRPVTGQAAANLAGDVFQERTVSMTETDEQAVVAKEARVVEEVVVSKSVDERVEQINDSVRHTEVDVQQQPPGSKDRM